MGWAYRNESTEGRHVQERFFLVLLFRPESERRMDNALKRSIYFKLEFAANKIVLKI